MTQNEEIKINILINFLSLSKITFLILKITIVKPVFKKSVVLSRK